MLPGTDWPLPRINEGEPFLSVEALAGVLGCDGDEPKLPLDPDPDPEPDPELATPPDLPEPNEPPVPPDELAPLPPAGREGV